LNPLIKNKLPNDVFNNADVNNSGGHSTRVEKPEFRSAASPLASLDWIFAKDIELEHLNSKEQIFLKYLGSWGHDSWDYDIYWLGNRIGSFGLFIPKWTAKPTLALQTIKINHDYQRYGVGGSIVDWLYITAQDNSLWLTITGDNTYLERSLEKAEMKYSNPATSSLAVASRSASPLARKGASRKSIVNKLAQDLEIEIRNIQVYEPYQGRYYHYAIRSPKELEEAIGLIRELEAIGTPEAVKALEGVLPYAFPVMEQIYDDHGDILNIATIISPVYFKIKEALEGLRGKLEIHDAEPVFDITTLNTDALLAALRSARFFRRGSSGAIDLECITDKRLKAFLGFLNEHGLTNILVMGGAIRDIFTGFNLNDIDFTVKVELTEREREMSLWTTFPGTTRVCKLAMAELRKFASVLNIEHRRFLNPPGKGIPVEFEGLELQYAGPKSVSHKGKRIVMKRYFVDSRTGQGSSWKTGATLLDMAIDCKGNLYGDMGALDCLASGKIKISGDHDNFTLGNVLRALRLKHQFGLRFREYDYTIIKGAIGRYSQDELRAPTLLASLKRNLDKLLSSARDPQAAELELENLGITSLIRKVESSCAASPLAGDTLPIGFRNVPRLASETSLLGACVGGKGSARKLPSSKVVASPILGWTGFSEAKAKNIDTPKYVFNMQSSRQEISYEGTNLRIRGPPRSFAGSPISYSGIFRRIKEFLMYALMVCLISIQAGCTTLILMNPWSSMDTKIKVVSFDKSIKRATEIIQLNPEYAEGYYNRAIYYAQIGKLEEARQDYAKAIELNPQYFFALLAGQSLMPKDEKMKGIAVDAFFSGLKDDRYYTWRYVAADMFASANNAKFNDFITSKLNDPSWRARETATLFLGKLSAKFERPEAARSLVPMLKDDKPEVREAAVLSLGDKVKISPPLAKEFINILKTDLSPEIKFAVAKYLQLLNTPEVNEVKPLIQQIATEVKVVVIIPGVYNILQKKGDIGRDISKDCTKDWRLRKILELAGIKVIEHRWSGKYSDIPKAQADLDSTMAKALQLAGEHDKVITIMYSAGNWVGERLGAPDLSIEARQAIKENRIMLMSLSSPSKYNFTHLDPKWENVSALTDPISWQSVIHNMKHMDIPFNPFVVSPLVIPNEHNIQYGKFKDFHSSHLDPRVVSDRIIPKVLPNLHIPQLDKMLKEQDVSKWKYFPTRGSWPGVYNFETVKPRPHIEYGRGHLRDQFVPQSPQIPHQQPIPMPSQQPVHTPQPVYAPQQGSWPGQYNFNIRAPDNYYKQPFIMPQTPIIPPTPIILPPMRR